MKIRILLYKAKRDGKWIDNLIATWTQITHCWRLFGKQRKVVMAGYSHCEIWVPDWDGYRNIFRQLSATQDGKGKTTWLPPTYHGTSYTSTMGQIRSKGTIIQSGTCKRPASRVLVHPERWDYIEIDINEIEYHEMMRYLDDQVLNNAGYGKIDCLKFIGLGFITDDKRNICSEIVHNALVEGDILDGEHKVVSPLLLAVLLVKGGYIVEKL